MRWPEPLIQGGFQKQQVFRSKRLTLVLVRQVEDLHRILAWQNVLMCCVGVSKEEVPPAQQAQRVKREDVSAEGTADPRTVLVSKLGNGSGGSQPSTDQGSWPQVLLKHCPGYDMLTVICHCSSASAAFQLCPVNVCLASRLISHFRCDTPWTAMPGLLLI